MLQNKLPPRPQQKVSNQISASLQTNFSKSLPVKTTVSPSSTPPDYFLVSRRPRHSLAKTHEVVPYGGHQPIAAHDMDIFGLYKESCGFS